MDTNGNTQIKIQYLNCNSLNTKLSEIKIHLQDTAPHILCLGETWLTQKFTPSFPNYCAEWAHRLGQAGGGLGILLHQELQYKPLALTPYADGALEAHGVTLYLPDATPLNLLNVYNPHKSVSFAEMNHFLSQLGSHYIVVGDFNAHSPILNSTVRCPNATGRALEALFDNTPVCLINPLNMYTYVDRRSGKQSCLDLCLSSPNIAPLLSISPLVDVGSDHLLLEITANLSLSAYTWYKHSRIIIRDESLGFFTMSCQPSAHILPTSINCLADDFAERIKSSASLAFGQPTRSRLVHRRKTPWWNPQCHAAVAARRRAYRLFRSHPTMENLGFYRTLTTVARNTLHDAKKTSFQSFVSGLDHTIPQGVLWSHLKAFKSTYAPQTFPLEVNGVPLLDPLLKADHFNKYFCDKYAQLLPSVDFQPVIDAACLGNFGGINGPIGLAELDRHISSLKNSSPGHDLIPNRLLAACHPQYKSDLLALYNQSLASGQVPLAWKHGIVLPFSKPHKLNSITPSYRPITLLSCVGKLMEKVIQKRLEYHLESHCLLSHTQYGFRPRRSIEDIVLQLKAQITTALSSKQYCCVVYLDLQGAFDGVWRHGLLYKLSQLGIKGNLLRWFCSYLQDRTQAVLVHGTTSSSATTTAGVPQGAVLSPTLFNVMLSDIPLHDRIATYIFADDITIACSGSSVATVESLLQEHLNTLAEWFGCWKFTIIESKSKLQVFSRKRNTLVSLSLHGKQLDSVKEQRLLGVLFDAPHLTWKSHVNHIVSDCRRRTNIMKCIAPVRWGASYHVLRMFYTAYIRAKLSFCCTAFSSASMTHIKRLCAIQNACLRLILGARRSTPILSLEAESGIPPLPLYYDFRLARLGIQKCFSPAEDPTPHLTFGTDSPFRQLLAKFGMGLMPRQPTVSYPAIPQWELPQDTILLSAPCVVDSCQAFQIYVGNRFRHMLHFYTDGSKLSDSCPSVSAGLYVPNCNRAFSWHLHPDHSIVAAELFAILKTLQYIEKYHSGEDCIIFTDSRTALQMVLSCNPSYLRTVNLITKLLQSLNVQHSVLLHWVRAHVGIPGNETADRVAHAGHSIDKSVLFPLHPEELLSLLYQGFKTYWNRSWLSLTTAQSKGLFLRGVRDNIFRPSPVQTGHRNTDSALFRLRLGHCGLRQYLYRFQQSDTNLCDLCQEPDTIDHYVFYCDKYVTDREAFIFALSFLIKRPPPFTIKLVLGGENYPPSVNKQILCLLGRYIRSTGGLTML